MPRIKGTARKAGGKKAAADTPAKKRGRPSKRAAADNNDGGVDKKKAKAKANVSKNDNKVKVDIPSTTNASATTKAKRVVNIPIDSMCHLHRAPGNKVCEDYNAMLNQTNIGANNNKFYRDNSSF